MIVAQQQNIVRRVENLSAPVDELEQRLAKTRIQFNPLRLDAARVGR
jgi:hypothetical protein